MPTQSLRATCEKACIKNIRSITNVGCLEYSQIHKVLRRIQSPSQLLEIERNCPQIAGEDAELWRAFIARDIPEWTTKNYVPKDPRKWHKVYAKYKKEQTEKIRRDEEILRESLAGIKKKKDGMIIEIVDSKKLPKLPKDSRMIGNAGILNGGKRSLFKKDSPSGLTWNSGSKTKVTDGKSVLTRVRREAKEVAQRGRLARPAHQTTGQVARAPEGMVNEYKRKAEPPIKILAKRRNIVGTLPSGGPSMEDREARLRALTMRQPSAASGATMVGSSDEEDSEDDIFDEPPKRSTTSSSQSSTYTARPSVSSPSTRPPPTASRPISRPSSSQPPNRRPDTISSSISKPRPLPRVASLSPTREGINSSSGIRRSTSPGPPPKPMMPRKRPPVDVFNRKVKRPRMG